MIGIDEADVEHYHRIRNTLYHNGTGLSVDDEYLIIECYRKLDPTTFTDVNDDIFLKRYVTALFKKQWGASPQPSYWHYWLNKGQDMP